MVLSHIQYISTGTNHHSVYHYIIVHHVPGRTWKNHVFFSRMSFHIQWRYSLLQIQPQKNI